MPELVVQYRLFGTTEVFQFPIEWSEQAQGIVAKMKTALVNVTGVTLYEPTLVPGSNHFSLAFNYASVDRIIRMLDWVHSLIRVEFRTLGNVVMIPQTE